MNKRYIKDNIYAIQWNGKNEKEIAKIIDVHLGYDGLYILNSREEFLIQEGDWIIIDKNNNPYPCYEELFNQLFGDKNGSI